MSMTCWETFQAYGLRSIGLGERLLPKTDFTLCEHFVLIGSGLVWNLYFGILALFFGFFGYFRHFFGDFKFAYIFFNPRFKAVFFFSVFAVNSD